MERKILAACALGLNLLILSAPAKAGGGAMGGGATEITQLMNNAELVMQVSESMQTTINTLQTAHSTMQMLRSLPQHLVSQISAVPLEQVRQMAQAYEVMKSAQDSYKDAADVLKKAASDSQRLGITPSELLAYKADAAQRHGGVYRTSYEQEQEKIRRASQASKDVQKQADTIKDINSNVSGLQMLATQNMSIQTSLGNISTSISRANELAFQEQEREKDKEERRARFLAKHEEEFQKKEEQQRQALNGGRPPNIINKMYEDKKDKK